MMETSKTRKVSSLNTWIFSTKGKVILSILAVLGLISASIAVVNVSFWPTWTGINGKTAWDIGELLFIPLTLIIIAYFFNKRQKEYELEIAQQQRELEREIAENRLQETALQNYFDRMSTLLFNEKLHPSDESYYGGGSSEIPVNHKARIIARVHTLSILESLSSLPISGARKGRVLQFLYEASLITDEARTVNLKGANLRNVELSEKDFSGIQLEGVDLKEAKLSYSVLGDANLCYANLHGAFLNSADLGSADLRGANLYGAFLLETNLFDANLEETNLIKADLTEANLWLANLRGADLSYTDLNFAVLNGANLSNTIMKETHLFGAKYDDSTIWPENFSPELFGAEKEPISNVIEDELVETEELGSKTLNSELLEDSTNS